MNMPDKLEQFYQYVFVTRIGWLNWSAKNFGIYNLCLWCQVGNDLTILIYM